MESGIFQEILPGILPKLFAHILCYDLWFYISHVIIHKPSFYKIHHKHHSTPFNKLNYTAAIIGSKSENIIQNLGVLVPCFYYVNSIYYLIIAYILISIRGAMRHDNKYSWLIGNHHLLHHKYPKYNYGEYWLDYLCGTMYPNKSEYIYGLIYS
jgi:lathosterol oxidase